MPLIFQVHANLMRSFNQRAAFHYRKRPEPLAYGELRPAPLSTLFIDPYKLGTRRMRCEFGSYEERVLVRNTLHQGGISPGGLFRTKQIRLRYQNRLAPSQQHRTADLEIETV